MQRGLNRVGNKTENGGKEDREKVWRYCSEKESEKTVNELQR